MSAYFCQPRLLTHARFTLIRQSAPLYAANAVHELSVTLRITLQNVLPDHIFSNPNIILIIPKCYAMLLVSELIHSVHNFMETSSQLFESL